MLKAILGTFVSRIFIAISAFLVIIINASYLGAEKVGVISLILLGITIVMMFNNLVGGGAVFMIPKFGLKIIMKLSYSWAVLVSVVGTIVLYILHLIPDQYLIHVLLLTLLFSFCSINQSALLGINKIHLYNFVGLIQALILLISLLVFMILLHRIEIIAYIYSLYISYTALFFTSLMPLLSEFKKGKTLNKKQILKEMLKYGFFIQIANLVQLFNYRYIYYVIEFYLGKSSLGVFDVSNKLSEGIWLTPRSLATIQYSKISNSNDKEYALKLTLAFLKLSSIATLAFIGIILFLPLTFFVSLFGVEFEGVKHIMLSLAPGIFAVSISMILSHYFAGLGKYYINTITSSVGFVTLITLCVIFFPHATKYGNYHALFIAGLLVSAAYTLSVIIQFILFCKHTKIKFKSFLITKEDVSIFSSEFKKMIATKSKA